MGINRRQILKSTGVAVLASLSPLGGFASGLIEKRRVIVLQSGLNTDHAFAMGASANQVVPFQLTMENYSLLANILGKIHDGELLALIDPASELLIEQAVRDSNTRMTSRVAVSIPTGSDSTVWAHKLGESLVHNQHIAPAHPHSKDKLLALTVRA